MNQEIRGWEQHYQKLPCGCVYYADQGHVIRFVEACPDCFERLENELDQEDEYDE